MISFVIAALIIISLSCAEIAINPWSEPYGTQIETREAELSPPTNDSIFDDIKINASRRLSVKQRKAVLLKNIPPDEGECPSRETQSTYFGLLNLPKEYISHKVSFRSCIHHHNETAIADIHGPGAVTQFWMVTGIGQRRQRPKMCVWTNDAMTLMLRIYVDGEKTPRVEVPLGPMFGIHHDVGDNWGNSNPYGADNNLYKVSENGAFTFVAPIPFSKGCRITLQDESPDLTLRMRIWAQVNYNAYDPRCPMPETMRLNAAYRIQDRAKEYVVPEGRPELYKRAYVVGHGQGKGYLLGATFGFMIEDKYDWWFHNSGELIVLDPLTNPRVMKGTGGEDFFLTSCWFHEHHNYPDWGFQSGDNQNKFSAYRWFIGDVKVPFRSSFLFMYGQNRNFVASTMYWYQEGEALPVNKAYPLSQRTRQDPIDPSLRVDPPTGPIRYWNFTPMHKMTHWGHSHFDVPVHFDEWTFIKPSFGIVTVGEYFFKYGAGNEGYPADVFIWARAFYDSPKEQNVRLMITHDDPLEVYLNDFLVYNFSLSELPGMHSFDVITTLDEGQNSFVVKVGNGENNNARAMLFGLNLFFEESEMKPQRYFQEEGKIVNTDFACG